MLGSQSGGFGSRSSNSQSHLVQPACSCQRHDGKHHLMHVRCSKAGCCMVFAVYMATF